MKINQHIKPNVLAHVPGQKLKLDQKIISSVQKAKSKFEAEVADSVAHNKS